MLCFRCEHRASFLETGSQPRFECGNIENSNKGCYMFIPCRPVVMKKNKGDNRPAHGGYIGARVSAIKLAEDCHLELSDGWLHWMPGRGE